MPLLTKRSLLLAFLWILVGLVLLSVVFYLTLTWNLFSWQLQVDVGVVMFLTIDLLTIYGVFHLSKRTKENLETWVAFVVALALATIGVAIFIDLHNETIDLSFLGRTMLSPHWFHLLVLMVLSLPGFFWLRFPFLHWKSKAPHL